MQPAHVSRAVPVSPSSDEFRRVKYLLGLSVSSGSVEDVNVWHFSHNQAARFEKVVKERNIKTVLPAWYNTKHLGDSNSLERLNKRGFTFPANGKGMVFTTGNLNTSALSKEARFSLLNESPQTNASEDALAGTTHRFLLCQIAVGRAFVVDDPSELGNEGQLIPEGFDSLYLALSQGQTEDGANYKHDYCVTDPAQVLPMYVVQFIINPKRSRMSEDQRFSHDAHELAYSLEDQENSFTSSTLDGPMTPNIQKLYDRYDFFDPILYSPVSVRDKMVGSHSSGELAQHKLIGIDEAYEAAISESTKSDPLLNSRIVEIRKQLALIDEKLQDVNENAAKVEEQIYQTLQEALFSLQDATQAKMSALLTEEVELRRQLQQAEWIEGYLDDQRETSSKVDFLVGWKCHVQLRGDLCRVPLRTPSVLNAISADLELAGGLELRSRSDVIHRGEKQERLKEGFSYPDEEDFTLPETTPPKDIRGSREANTQPVLQVEEKQPPQAIPEPASQRATSIPQAVWDTAAQQLKQQMDSGVPPLSTAPKASPSPTAAEQRAPSSTPVTLQPSLQGVLDRTPKTLVQYSLHAEAIRRMRQLDLTGKDAFSVAEKAFTGSNLLDQPSLADLKDLLKEFGDDSDSEEEERPRNRRRRPLKKKKRIPVKVFCDAHALFMCLPLSSSVDFPATKLLFASSDTDTPNTIKALITSLPFDEIEYEDDDGNTATEKVMEEIPTVVLIKANGRVFGGYANEPWRSDGTTFGNSKCFLFSISLDIKIPFHGRNTLAPTVKPENNDDEEESVMSQQKLPTYATLKSDEKSFQFGVYDLVISNDFKTCSSNLEYTFGCGLQREGSDAKTLLAGSESFQIEEIELWGVIE